MDAEPPSSIRPDELLTQLSWMRALARSLVRHPELADDLLQQVCLLALQRGPDESREGPGFRAWLASAIRRMASHSGRASARRTRRERAAARPEALPSTLDSVQQREALTGLVEALTGLAEPHYSTIVQRYFEGRSVDELATSAAITPAAVRQRLSRAKQLLRERIEGKITNDRSGWLVIALGSTTLDRVPPPDVQHLEGLSMPQSLGGSGVVKLVGAAVVAIGVALVIGRPLADEGERTPAPRTAMAEAGSGAAAPVTNPALPTPVAAAPAPLVPVAIIAPATPDASGTSDTRDEGSAFGAVAASTPAPAAKLGNGSYRIVVVDAQAHVVPWAIVETLRPDPPPPEGPTGLDWTPNYVTVTSTRADAAGRCQVHLESPDDLLLARLDDLGASGLRTAARLDAAVNADGDTVIALLPYLPIEGLVLDAVGSPAGNCTITLLPAGADLLYGNPRPAMPITSGADGRFSAYVDHSNQYSIRAAQGDLVGGDVISPKPGELQWVTIHLPGNWSIGGTLVDEHGAPLAGVKVVAMRAQDETDQDLAAAPPPGHIPPGFRDCMQAETQADGSFSMPITTAGRYGVTAIPRLLADFDRKPGDPPPARQTLPDAVWVDIQGLDAHPTVALARPAATSIFGRVVTAGDEPAKHAIVEVRAAPPTLLDGSTFLIPTVTRLRTTKSRAQGRFQFEALPVHGTFEIRAYLPHAGRFEPGAPVQPPSEAQAPWQPVAAGGADVTLVATTIPDAAGPATGSIRITVRAADPGTPLNNLRWNVQTPGGAGSVLLSIGGTLKDGVIVVPALDPALKYSVAVAADGLGGVDVQDVEPTPQGTEVAVQLPAFGALDVAVVGANGAPVPYAQVEITRSFVLSREFLTWGVDPQAADTQGIACFGSLDPGSYRVVVQAAGQRVESSIEVASGHTTAMQLSLQDSKPPHGAR